MFFKDAKLVSSYGIPFLWAHYRDSLRNHFHQYSIERRRFLVYFSLQSLPRPEGICISVRYNMKYSRSF